MRQGPATGDSEVASACDVTSTTVLISTYNNPRSLRLCLLGMLNQKTPPDQIIVADDGSTPETAAILHDPMFADLPLEWVWHPDNGWQKCAILNLAMSYATGEYLIFCDGDTIPRQDFVAAHLRNARRQTFLSGGCVNIPATVHQSFTATDVTENAVFTAKFLAQSWPAAERHRRKPNPGPLETPLNLLTWRYCVLRGANFSAWRKDLEQVNGFNEALVYGSEDRELGVRLRNSGVASRWLRYSLVQLHLDHAREGYLDHGRARQQRWQFRKLFFAGGSRIEPGLDTARERSDAGGTPGHRHRVIAGTTRQLALVGRHGRIGFQEAAGPVAAKAA